jgi:hypothetical protein
MTRKKRTASKWASHRPEKALIMMHKGLILQAENSGGDGQEKVGDE